MKPDLGLPFIQRFQDGYFHYYLLAGIQRLGEAYAISISNHRAAGRLVHERKPVLSNANSSPLSAMFIGG